MRRGRPTPLTPMRPIRCSSTSPSSCANGSGVRTGLSPTPISRGGPQVLPPSTGGVIAYKFRDPDGHPLELINSPRRRAAGVGPMHRGCSSASTIRPSPSATSRGRSASSPYPGPHPFGAGFETGGLSRLASTGLDDPVVDVVALSPPDPAPHVELLHYGSLHGRTPLKAYGPPIWRARASSSRPTIPRTSRKRYAARASRRAFPSMAAPASSRGRTGTASSSCAGVDAAGRRRHSPRGDYTDAPPRPALPGHRPRRHRDRAITIKWYALAISPG